LNSLTLHEFFWSGFWAIPTVHSKEWGALSHRCCKKVTSARETFWMSQALFSTHLQHVFPRRPNPLLCATSPYFVQQLTLRHGLRLNFTFNISWPGWPDWANFRLHCLPWEVLRKLQNLPKCYGYFLPPWKFFINTDKKWVGLLLGRLFHELVWSPWSWSVPWQFFSLNYILIM
jgi:hypothetical protein